MGTYIACSSSPFSCCLFASCGTCKDFQKTLKLLLVRELINKSGQQSRIDQCYSSAPTSSFLSCFPIRHGYPFCWATLIYCYGEILVVLAEIPLILDKIWARVEQLILNSLKKYLFIDVAVLGLSCGMQDLCTVCEIFPCRAQALCWGAWASLYLWLRDPVVAAHGMSGPVACGILVPQPGLQPGSPDLGGGF